MARFARLLLFWTLFVFSFSDWALSEDDPRITIETGNTKIALTRTRLLRHPLLQTISIENDPHYQAKNMLFPAIRLTDLLGKNNLKLMSSVVLKNKDGASVELTKTDLYSEENMPMVAIEMPYMRWPSLPKKKASAGPYYLIWKTSREPVSAQWLPALHSVEMILATAKKGLPAHHPNPGLDETSPAQRGYRVFEANCTACHTMNLFGDGTKKIGPDLNLPMNPTEYFKEEALRKFIRNPQNVRHWTDSRMTGFSEHAISNEELEHLLAYLHHMSDHKPDEQSQPGR